MAAAGSSGWGWRRVLRLTLTVVPPLIGVVLIGQAVVASIGGDIRRWEFALGAACLCLTVAGRLVPEE
ncbi:hypothetical protein DA075_00215 [Methylobacterium currus]|uniref:Uncharacterized protein n=1 Tax=Methylobacterium currus TaxID=2051553 RepID=A0A2R4WDE0_9HYPH|nr:hypothetical protein [Methylobacterium currus]AWB19553.1 hypothetical protein DA075_00215 [Methylobacterium currus]UHC15748.1 hypothetical protein LRS73_25130 [Methylobacterium currus]